MRARGELRLSFAARGGRTRMVDAYQSGCLRARLPRSQADEAPCVVLINVGGGVTGGDRLEQSVQWQAGAAAAVTTQAAEKIYRSAAGDAHIDTRLSVAAAARAEWLPQETILFDRARLDRRLQVDIAEDGHFLGVESLVLGRTAMGETVSDATIRDSWRVVRGGRLIYADVLRLAGPIDAMMDRAAIGDGARAMAVILCVSTDSAALLAPAREAFAQGRCRVAASAWNGMLVVRFLAPDGQTLRDEVAPVLSALRGGRPLPRVWSC